MRENRLSGSEGGATLIPSSLPLSISSPSGTKVDNPVRDTIHQSLSTKSTPHHSASGFEDSLSDVAIGARWLAVLSASEVGRMKRLVSALQNSFTEDLSRRAPQVL
jgi:hypothetical protein